VLWYTNLDHGSQPDLLRCTSRYNGYEANYPRYDNYDAIEVSAVAAIPADYTGVMGVPVTFIFKYNPAQFEIVGATESERPGVSAGLWDSASGVLQAMVRGELVYKRLFVRHRSVC
jgi:hypothetical protein